MENNISKLQAENFLYWIQLLNMIFYTQISTKPEGLCNIPVFFLYAKQTIH